MPLPKGFILESKPEVEEVVREPLLPAPSNVPKGFTLETREPFELKPVDPTLPQYIKYKINVDRASSARGDFGANAMVGLIDTDTAITKGNEARDFWIEKAGPYDNVPFSKDPIKNVAGNVASLIPYMISSQKEGLAEGVAVGAGFAAIVGIIGQVPPLTFMPEEFALMPAAFAAGMSIGYTDGVIRHTLRREGGSMYLDMIEQGISEETARPLAIAGGTIIGLIELASFRTLGKPFKHAFGKLLRTPTGGNAIVQAVGRYFKTVGIEVAQEDLQEISSLTVETIAGLIDEKPGAIPTKKEWMQRLIETTKAMVTAMPIIAAPGAIVDVTSSIRLNRIAKNKADLSKLGKVLEVSKAQDKSPLTDTGERGPQTLEGDFAPFAKGKPTEVTVASFVDERGRKLYTRITPEEKQALLDEVAKIPAGEKDSSQLHLDSITPALKREAAEISREEFIAGHPQAKEILKVSKVAKVTTQEVKDLVIEKNLKSRLDEIVDKKDKADTAKDMLDEGNKVEQFLTKETVKLKEVNDALGTDFTKKSEVNSFLKTWQEEKTNLEAIIDEGKVEVVKKSEITAIKQRLRDIQTGIKKGQQISRQEVKTAQSEVIAFLKKSNLTAQDKAKFIATLKNIQTQEQLSKAIPSILNRITRLEQAEQKRIIEAQIKKELKATKPVKKGQKKVGRYGYQSNKLFDSLRSINKLSKSKALSQLEAIPEEFISEMDLVKRRVLSLKVNGKEASPEMFSKVLEDIKRMKQIGEQAKSDADFEKLMNRQEKVEQALQAIGNVKADKKGIKTKIGNIYRKGFTNIYSMLNSMFGKEFAEEYDPELNENQRETSIFRKTLEMTNEAARIYDNKNAVNLLFRDMSKKEYKITDIDDLTTQLTKLDLIDIYNSIKNKLGKERYSNAFGEAQVQSLIGELTQEDIEFADYLQEQVQGYRKVLNERNIEVTGRDLGFQESYWPFSSEHQVSVLDDLKVQGETPSALKERAKSSKIIPIPQNAWIKAQRHVGQAEHVKNLTRQYETLKRLFNDRKVKHAIKEKFGDDVYNVLNDQIDNVSLNKQVAKIDAVSKWFGFVINNWVTSKIALNPSTYVRQLMSMGNFIENMNPGDWVKGFSNGIKSPKETFNFMWNNAPFLEARFNRGYSEAIQEAIKGAESLNTHWSSYTKFLSSLARSGDITAIIYGGFPFVKSEIAKHKANGLGNKESIKLAMETFEKATLKSQQSGLSSSVSQFQNSRNPFARLFLAFKNTANQYFRKQADAVISFQNGDISAQQFAKIMTIYAVIQPTLYAASGFLLKEAVKGIGSILAGKPGDDPQEVAENLFLAIITQMVVSPVNAIPLLNGIMTYITRKATGQKAWKVFSIPLFDDLTSGFQKLTKKEATAEDYLKAMASIFVEPITALPLNTFLRYFKNLTGENSKDSSLKPL